MGVGLAQLLTRAKLSPLRSAATPLLALALAVVVAFLVTGQRRSPIRNAASQPRVRLPAIARNELRLQAEAIGSDAGAPTAAPHESGAPAARGPFAFMKRDREQQKVLYEAEERAIAGCMKERGFDYTPNAFDDGLEVERSLVRYEPGDVEVASAIGYGLAEAIAVGEIPLRDDANADRLQTMSPERRQAWSTALQGPPPPDELIGIGQGGTTSGARANHDPAWPMVSTGFGPSLFWYRDSCLSRARRDLQGDELLFTQQEVQVRSLIAEAQAKADNDSEYLAGVDRWRTCMHAHGFYLDEPETAPRQLSEQYRSGTLTLDELRLREVEIATADAGCFRSADLGTLRAAAVMRAEREVAGSNPDAVRAFERALAETLERARRPAAAPAD